MTDSPSVTWPSPARTTLPSRRTDKTVVDRISLFLPISVIFDYSSEPLSALLRLCKVNVLFRLQIASVTTQAITAVTFLEDGIALSVLFMPKFAAVLCQDQKSLQVLRTVLNQMDTELTHCRS